MSVTSVDPDFENLTITLVGEYAAPVERVWQLWADPRLLERWWGPPSFPATVEQHELRPGGSVSYFMTGPEGEKYPGWWRIDAVDAPTALEFTDGFTGEDGRPAPDMPVSAVRVELAEHDGRTRMEVRSAFQSREQMEQIVDMGALEGLRQAAGQIDALLDTAAARG